MKISIPEEQRRKTGFQEIFVTGLKNILKSYWLFFSVTILGIFSLYGLFEKYISDKRLEIGLYESYEVENYMVSKFYITNLGTPVSYEDIYDPILISIDSNDHSLACVSQAFCTSS